LLNFASASSKQEFQNVVGGGDFGGENCGLDQLSCRCRTTRCIQTITDQAAMINVVNRRWWFQRTMYPLKDATESRSDHDAISERFFFCSSCCENQSSTKEGDLSSNISFLFDVRKVHNLHHWLLFGFVHFGHCVSDSNVECAVVPGPSSSRTITGGSPTTRTLEESNCGIRKQAESSIPKTAQGHRHNGREPVQRGRCAVR